MARHGFVASGEGFFRASFSNSYEQLIRATDAIERFVGTLQPVEAAAK